jgi:mono/diheme cytochrome c family protein
MEKPMSVRFVLCLAALAAAGAAVVTALPSAQEVKEQWNIATPPPADANTTWQGKPGTPPAPASTAAGQAAAGGATNAHGLPIVKNPDTGDAAAIAAGKDLFVAKACSGCHGAGGGGGMCPPVINDTWVYGSDDTTLFNLIKLGSSGLQAKGYARVGHEKVVGDMPAFAGVVSDEEAWKLLAYIRSKYAGDPALRNW